MHAHTSPPPPPPVVMTENVSRHCLQTTHFTDPTGIPGARMALLSCCPLGGDGLAILLPRGWVGGGPRPGRPTAPRKAAWRWVRWLPVCGAPSPSLQGVSGPPQCSCPVLLYNCRFTSQHLPLSDKPPENRGHVLVGSVSSKPSILHGKKHWLDEIMK